MAGKARVHELAKELGVESKVIMSWLKDNGIFVKSASSTVEAPDVRRLRVAMNGSAPDSAGRMRVHELAREVGISPTALVALLGDMGEYVKSASSRVEAPVVRRVREAVSASASASPARPALAAPLPSATPLMAGVRHMSLDELASDLHRSPAELVPWLQARGLNPTRPGVLIPAGDVREARRAFGAQDQAGTRQEPAGSAVLAERSLPVPQTRVLAALPTTTSALSALPARATTQPLAGPPGAGREAPAQAIDPHLWRDRGAALHASDPSTLGDYELLSRLGHGGMGTVYRARREGTVGDVALKTLQTHLYVDDEALRRFEREAQVLQRVGGTFTARVTDSGADHGRPFLVMELLDGLTLERAVEIAGPLPPPVVHVVAVGLASALTALHGQDIVHRDVKPSNLMITTAGLKVIDFGIARLAEGTQYTATGGLLGTWAYMTPEQFTDPNHLTPAVDVFAWATTVLFAMSGGSPYSGRAPVDFMQRILAGPPPVLSTVPNGGLKDLLRAALAPAPEDRPKPQTLVDGLAGGLTEIELRAQSRSHLRAFLLP